MSTQQTRSGDGGGRTKGKKSGGGGSNDTNANKKSDLKTDKDKLHSKQPTAEQIRIAQIVDIKSDSDDKMQEKVQNLMEMTQRSEEEVCCALYECDNDLNRAVNFLLESLPVGAFETSSKKKKNRLASVSNDTGEGDWNDNSNSGQNGQNNNADRDKSRNRGGMRGGRGGTDSRGWRGRENRENDRNNQNNDSREGGGNFRGMRGDRGGRGGGRGGGYVGRGGRGGRMGPRPGGGGREFRDRNTTRQNDNHQEVDTWDNNTNQVPTEINTWGDWDNEEYTGSLTDTKVFTPSAQSQAISSEMSAPPGLEQQVLNPPSHPDDLVVSSTTTAAAVAAANNAVQFPEIQTPAQLRQASIDMQQQLSAAAAAAAAAAASSSLSVEQSQYFNSLTSQNTGQPNMVNVNSYQAASVQYSAPYGTGNSYVEQVGSAQPQRKPTRARVPPPSKIPATAVEMPGDTMNNIQYLDVQFGGLDFGNEESFDSLTEKFNQASIDAQSQSVQTAQDVATEYQNKASVVQQQQQVSMSGSGTGASNVVTGGVMQSSQMGGADTMATSYAQRASGQQQSATSQGVVNSINNSTGTALDQLTKTDHYNQSNAAAATGNSGAYPNVAASYSNTASSNNKSAAFQPTQTPQGYTNTNYSNTQVSSNSNYQQSASTYSTYNPTSAVNSYQQQQQSNTNSNSSVTASVNATGGVSSNSNSTQSLPVNNSGASSNSNSGYLSSQYPSVTQASSAFPSQQTGYQNSQSVYGTSGLSNSSGYSSNTNASAGQYGNFSSSKLKETTTPVSTPYESVSSSTSSAPSSVSNSAVTTSSMSSPSLGLANTKVTNSTAKSGGNVVQNIPMVSQYIQTGMPFYQQPVYSFEDIQIMQRMPHVQPGYYDINYQTPTSLGPAAVRDGNLGSIAYSTMSDARFTRTDNNSSPVSNVPSTISQQTGSGGPMLNLPYYTFYGGMPGQFQYGTPAIYPQQMPQANATSGGQFAKPSYNSGYGSGGYDGLSQTAQDYSKGGYPGTGVGQQTKGQTVSNPQPAGTGSDITSSMYGKSHVALNKVNSYDKQSFHSGTPPPFNLPGTQTAGATPAQGYSAQHIYLPTIPTMPASHHNMNIHQQMHQDSSSTGQRQQSSSQGKTGTKQGYSPSYWTAQN